jgi:hypothetical protein
LFFENVAIWNGGFYGGAFTTTAGYGLNFYFSPITSDNLACLMIVIPLLGFLFTKPRQFAELDTVIVVLSASLAFFYVWNVISIFVLLSQFSTLPPTIEEYFGLTCTGRLLDLIGWVSFTNTAHAHTKRTCDPISS